MNINRLSPEQLRKAADIQERIQTLQQELGDLLNTEITGAGNGNQFARKRRLSAAGRAAIGAATKARWARFRKHAGNESKRKRKMSAAGRAAIAAAVKARWAKAKAAGKSKI